MTNDFIFWGGVKLPASIATEHFGLIGAPGSGKTKLLQLLMQSIVHTIGSGRNRRAVIYDAKREMYSTLLGMGVSEDRLIILNPFDARSSAWNMALDIDDPATATEIATILVPERGEREPFFPEAARGLMAGVMEAFILSARGVWTLRDVILALRSASRLEIILSRSESTRHLIEKYLTGTDTQRDIAATLENVVRRLGFIAAAWDNTLPEKTISLQKWLATESILLLGSHPVLESCIQQLNSAILHRLTQVILQSPEASEQPIAPQTWIVIDELRMAGKLSQLPGFMVQARSKGGCVAWGLQDLPGMIDVYGEHLAHELIGSVRNLAFLKIIELKTAEFASNVFGMQEVRRKFIRRSWGWSRALSRSGVSNTQSSNVAVDIQITAKSLVLPRQFKQIPDANRKNGIGAYFDTLCLGNPYHHNFSGEFIEQNVLRPHPSVPNLILRPREHQYLREWDEGDLDRLGFSSCPKLLGSSRKKGAKKESKQSGGGKRKRPSVPETGDLLTFLPRKP